MNKIYVSELYHHGIEGQKWGQRNGPPYPLDSSDYSPAEKRKAGKWLTKKDKELDKARFKRDEAYRNAYKLWRKDVKLTSKSAKKLGYSDIKSATEAMKSGSIPKSKLKKIQKNFQKHNELQEKITDNIKKGYDNSKIVKQGEQYINQTIKKMEKQGLTISSKTVERSVNHGKNAARMILSGFGAVGMATISPIGVGVSFYKKDKVYGNKYKVN